MPDLILGLLPLDRPLEASDHGHDLFVGCVRRQQENPGTYAPDLHFIAGESKFLGQPYSLAIAMLEHLGGLYHRLPLVEYIRQVYTCAPGESSRGRVRDSPGSRQRLTAGLGARFSRNAALGLAGQLRIEPLNSL